jgi:hypothetical protein
MATNQATRPKRIATKTAGSSSDLIPRSPHVVARRPFAPIDHRRESIVVCALFAGSVAMICIVVAATVTLMAYVTFGAACFVAGYWWQDGKKAVRRWRRHRRHRR